MHRHRRKPRPLRLLDVAPSSYLRLSAANLSFFNPAEFFSAAALHDRAIGTNTRRWLKLANSPLIVATSPSSSRFLSASSFGSAVSFVFSPAARAQSPFPF
jgi:hypothetical protein